MPNNNISSTLRWLANGPCPDVTTYDGYLVNGRRYHTEERDRSRSVQNCGVSLVASTMQVSSAKDKNPIISDMVFYGVIQEIWELNYYNFTYILFKCAWVDSNKSIKIDELGFTTVDFNRLGHKSDPFILATQATQVFYVDDPMNPGWSVVLSLPQRDHEEFTNDDELGDTIIDCYGLFKSMPDISTINDMNEDQSTYTRTDCDGTWIDNK